jgi:hypothetical protein
VSVGRFARKSPSSWRRSSQVAVWEWAKEYFEAVLAERRECDARNGNEFDAPEESARFSGAFQVRSQIAF